jgi:hypothetical protein
MLAVKQGWDPSDEGPDQVYFSEMIDRGCGWLAVCFGVE